MSDDALSADRQRTKVAFVPKNLGGFLSLEKVYIFTPFHVSLQWACKQSCCVHTSNAQCRSMESGLVSMPLALVQPTSSSIIPCTPHRLQVRRSSLRSIVIIGYVLQTAQHFSPFTFLMSWIFPRREHGPNWSGNEDTCAATLNGLAQATAKQIENVANILCDAISMAAPCVYAQLALASTHVQFVFFARSDAV